MRNKPQNTGASSCLFTLRLWPEAMSGDKAELRAEVRHVRMTPDVDFFEELQRAIKECLPPPKMLILNFPGNPTTQCVELDFFEKAVAICREHGIWLVHDLAYADIVFDGYRAPSVLQAKGAKATGGAK